MVRPSLENDEANLRPKRGDEPTGKEILCRLLNELSRYTKILGRPKTEPGEPKSKRSKTISEPCPFVVGFNQVTRQLERDNLIAVFACKGDLVHDQLLHHLPFQCRLNEVTLVGLPAGATTELTSLLGIPNITVIGVIREGSQSLVAFLNFINARIRANEGDGQDDLSRYKALCINRIAIPKMEAKRKDKKKKPTRK